jgi:hypothetical protein
MDYEGMPPLTAAWPSLETGYNIAAISTILENALDASPFVPLPVPYQRDRRRYTALHEIAHISGAIKQDLNSLQLVGDPNWANGATLTITYPCSPQNGDADFVWHPINNYMDDFPYEHATNGLAAVAMPTAVPVTWSEWLEPRLTTVIYTNALTYPGYWSSWDPWHGEEFNERCESVKEIVEASKLLTPVYFSYTLNELYASMRMSALMGILGYLYVVQHLVIKALEYVAHVGDTAASVMAIIHTFMAHRHGREPEDGLLFLSKITVRSRRVALIR